MSQQLGGLRPLNIPISGNADATGAATITFAGRNIYWTAVYAAIEVSAGTPSLAIRDQAGMPVIFGGAGQSILGPFMIPPARVLNLVVTGAAANAAIKGQIIGWEAADPSQLPPALPNSSSVSISGGTVTATITSGTVSISGTPTVQFAAGQTVTFTNNQINIQGIAGGINVGTQQPATVLGTVSPAASTSGTLGPFTLPVGTHAVGLWVTAGAIGGWWSSIAVYANGQPTLEQLLTAQVPRKQQYVFPVIQASGNQAATTVSCDWVRGTTVGTPALTLVAILDTQCVYQLASRGDDDLPSSDARPQGASLFNIPTTSIAAAGVLSIEAGVTNYFQVIWVVQWEYSTGGTGITQLELSDGTILASTLQNTTYPQVFRGGGIIYGAAGLGLQFRNTGAGAVTLNGYAMIGFSPIRGRAA